MNINSSVFERIKRNLSKKIIDREVHFTQKILGTGKNTNIWKSKNNNFSLPPMHSFSLSREGVIIFSNERKRERIKKVDEIKT